MNEKILKNKMYISHANALYYWNIKTTKQYFRKEIELAKHREYMVLEPKNRIRINGIFPHVCTAKIPKGGLINDSGVNVVSKQLMYIQMASILDIHKTIILGNQLCAKSDGPFSKNIISKVELQNFVMNAKGVPGQSRALRALKYVKEDSCSQMEIFYSLILSLPMQLGGLGLKGGVFNYKVIFNPNIAKAFDQKVCFIDYCFPEQKIAYEYQGEHHRNTLDRDSFKAIALRQMGYDVIAITKSMLYDPDKLQQLLNEVISIHKIRFRVRSSKYEAGLKRICELLPRY